MASKLKLWRVARDLTQEKLSKLSGIPQQRLSEIERGLRPGDAELVKLSRAGVPVAEFFISPAAAPEMPAEAEAA